MFETLDPNAMLATWAFSPWLDGTYVVSLIVAGGLLTISTLFGGDADADINPDFDADLDVDFDADVDLDVDVDADIDVDADVGADIDADGLHGDGHVGDLDVHGADGLLAFSSWFSLRFFIYFVAMFGFVGTTLTYLSDMSEGRVLIAALASGIVIGQIAHQIFRYLKRTGSDSSTSPRDYVKKLARVTIAIEPPAVGEVAIKIGNGERYIRAAAKREDDTFDTGDTVGVVALQAGTAIVVSQKEYQFLTTPMKDKGGTA